MFEALHVYSLVVGSLGQLLSVEVNSLKVLSNVWYTLLTAQTLIGTKLWCLTQSVEKHVATAMREDEEQD